MKKSIYFYLKSAFEKIQNASIEEKSCRLTFDECRAISIHPAIPDAIGNYQAWEFDDEGNILTDM